MKRFLFFIVAALLFCGCDKSEGGDPECPVTDVSLPVSSADNPVRPGTEVAIQGKGFTQSSEIWLRSVAEVKAAGAEVKAAVTSVTASAITFTAPEVYGAQTVVLKQDGGAWDLGTLTFAAEPTGPEGPSGSELLPDKVSNIRVTFRDEAEGDYVTEYAFTYDGQGRVAKLVTTEDEDEEDVLTTLYTYSDGLISAEGSGDGFIRSKTEKYALADGRVSAYTIATVEHGKYYDVTANILLSVRPTYDHNGYMTAVEGTETGDEEGDSWTSAFDADMVFTEGTLQKYALTRTTEYSDGDGAKDMLEVEWTAGPLNNLNIDLMGIDWLDEDIYFAPACLLNVGGKRSLRLPERIHEKYVEADADGTVYEKFDFTNEIEYEMSGDYISVMRVYGESRLETTVEIIYEK